MFLADVALSLQLEQSRLRPLGYLFSFMLFDLDDALAFWPRLFEVVYYVSQVNIRSSYAPAAREPRSSSYLV